MFDSPLAAWLLLHHVPGLGPLRLQRLYQELGSAQAILQASPHLLNTFNVPMPILRQLEACVATDAAHPWRERVSQDLEWAEARGHHLVCIEDDCYPALLRWLPDPPPVLYVRGRVELLASPQIGLVGTRHPTPGGRDNARAFAANLGQAGLTITSGLALGIDACAHSAALQSAAGTVAVLGTGVDTIYPASHAPLAAEIAEQGALISEFPLGTAPRAGNFPRRNRIISGLSVGVLVVEASIRSGSLITARLALEQGREIYAIPGSIHNPQARGCHQLIKQGAKLVETVEDILEELPALLAHYQALPKPAAKPSTDDLFRSIQAPSDVVPGTPEYEPVTVSEAASALLEALGYDPVPADVLVSRTGLPAHCVSAELMALELAGQVIRTPGGYQRSSG